MALVLVAAAILPAWTVRTAVADEQVVAEVPGAAGLTAFGGHVVWSAPNPATGRWKLMHWHAGRLTPLPVPERSVPFDADAGSDAQGRPTVVFSRCKADPTSSFGPPNWALATGCDLWWMRLDGGVARKLASVSTRSGSETTPSMWHGAIAFQRRRADNPVSQLLIRPRHARRLRSLPVGAVARRGQSSPLPGNAVSALDLGPRALAFVWLAPAEGGHGSLAWQLWVDTLPDARRIGVDSGGIGECSYQQPLSPNAHLAFDRTSIMFVRASSFCGDAPNPVGVQKSTITRYDWARNTIWQARTLSPFALEAASDGGTTWWLRGTAASPPSDPGDNPVTCAASGTPCQLIRSQAFIFDNVGLWPPELP
jgi:hypothetical protein